MTNAIKEIVTGNAISPRYMGWKASSERTALIDEPLELRTKAVPKGGTIYLCKFRPVKGEWLGQVLNAATSDTGRSVFSGAIRADWDLFKEAQREKDRIDKGEVDPATIPNSRVKLLLQHTQDPSIGEAMKEFGTDYADLWLNALADNNAALMRVFRPLEVVDGNFYPEQYIRDHEDSHQRDNIGGRFFHNDRQFSLAGHFRYAMEGQTSHAISFEREEFFAFADWLKTIFPDQHRLRSKLYPYITLYEDRDIIDTIPLDHNDPWLFPLSSTHSDVTKDGNYSWISRKQVWPNYTITDNEIVLFEGDTTATIALEQTNNPARPFAIVGRHVDFSDTTNALSPAVSWQQSVDPATGTVQRRFLNRNEITDHFATEFPGEVLDPWLGLITIVGFMPSVLERTHERLHLQEERAGVRREGGQNIFEAQTPVYWNRPDKRKQIARDSDGVLASIESL